MSMTSPPDRHAERRGECRLCRNTRELQLSHFIPAALYPKTRILFGATPTAAIISPDEMAEYLLCRDCEERLNRNGESYALRLIAPKVLRYPFPLLDLLKAARPVQNDPGPIDQYAAADLGIDTGKLAYFALSIAWRASVHAWQLPDGQVTEPHDLGPYTDRIRLFLLEQAAFPLGVSVVVIVCRDPFSRDYWTTPAFGDDEEWSKFHFVTRGVFFVIWIGADLPDERRAACCWSAPGKPVFAADCEDRLRRNLMGLPAL